MGNVSSDEADAGLAPGNVQIRSACQQASEAVENTHQEIVTPSSPSSMARVAGSTGADDAETAAVKNFTVTLVKHSN